MAGIFANVVSWFANDGESADELQARDAAVEARLDLENERDHARGGEYGESWWEQVQENDRRDDLGDVGEDLEETFAEEWFAQVDKRKESFGDLINGVFKTVFGIVPWQVWLIGLAVLAFYLIGPERIKKAFSK